MATIEETVEVGVPVRTAYDQWTQFEEFPRFMEEVREVRQIDETHLHWVAEVAGHDAEWDAEIIEQQVLKNPVTGGWRLVFQVRPRGGAPVDLRAFLRRGEQTLTETWVDTLEP